MNRFTSTFVLTFLTGGSGWALDIGFCGSDVPPGQVGVLQADLTCSSTQTGVGLEELATLQMNGHSISGAGIGVFCFRGCTVQGPGEIIGATNFGIVTSTNPRPRVLVEDVTIRDGAGSAIAFGAPGSLDLRNVTVTNNGGGVIATNAGRIRGTNVIITNNASVGAQARRLRFTGLTLQGNGAPGLLSFRGGVHLADSTLSGNNSGMGDLDLATRRRPGVYNTTCGRSARVPDPPVIPAPTDPSWGVCTSD